MVDGVQLTLVILIVTMVEVVWVWGNAAGVVRPPSNQQAGKLKLELLSSVLSTSSIYIHSLNSHYRSYITPPEKSMPEWMGGWMDGWACAGGALWILI